ncbi:hypothetical protein ACFW2V_12875 [Streptomyces sp. NPDC058947]|uniref:hypothetical protein n=1 Tax=Streptomyces sp. NPDC058947 TaxID=3346675 RepID=UPI0036971E3F
MSADEQQNIRNFVEGLAVTVIKNPSRRDQQKACGPSDLANTCDVCVAKKIASSFGMGGRADDGFSLKAWLGTAVHEKLERELPRIYPHAEVEITVRIGDIPGLGMVEGHTDVFLPRKRTVVDYKTSDKAKIEKYKKQAGPNAYTLGLTAQERAKLDDLKIRDRAGLLKPGDVDLATLTSLLSRSEANSGGVPPEYMGQTMLYLYGLRKMGRQADYAVLVFIPRDSNYITDIWVASCPYRPDVAEAVIRRASHLAKVVRSGRARELRPDPECWTCVKLPKFGRKMA